MCVRIANPPKGRREVKMTDPSYDLEAFIREENESGRAEVDPYSYATTVIAVTLEWALDDGINGAMNETEFKLLEDLAKGLIERDPHIRIEPGPG